jgi:K+-transporting ATPase c subunit
MATIQIKRVATQTKMSKKRLNKREREDGEGEDKNHQGDNDE